MRYKKVFLAPMLGCTLIFAILSGVWLLNSFSFFFHSIEMEVTWSYQSLAVEEGMQIDAGERRTFYEDHFLELSRFISDIVKKGQRRL